MIGLKLGDTSEHVKGLQELLRRTGFSVGEFTGTYNQATADAVLACRQTVDPTATDGTVITGQAYEQIMVAFILKTAEVPDPVEAPLVTERPLPRYGDTGEDVGWYQRMLSRAGYWPGKPTNVYDDAMKDALYAWYHETYPTGGTYDGMKVTSWVKLTLEDIAHGRG
jgi:peptidoglycan hydrolase-like protein with peptidoglycan-binding domain